MIYAVREGNYARLRELIAAHGDVDCQSPAGRTPLHAAAEEGDLEAARILIEAGANVQARMEDGQTPLHRVAGYGRPWDLMDADADRSDPCRRSQNQPIDRAVADAVMEIVKAGGEGIPADLEIDTTIPSGSKLNVFSAVLDLFADPKVLYDRLLARGIDVDTLDPHFSEFLRGNPRYVRVAKYLLDHGADVNAPDESGDSPLWTASGMGRAEMVELLLQHGATPHREADEDGYARSMVSEALSFSKVDVAELLYRAGAKFDPSGCLAGYASNGQMEVVKWLIGKGADVNHVSEDGKTALSDTADNGHDDMVRFLIEQGADASARDAEGNSVLHAAAPWPKDLEVLLPLGLSVEVKNVAGMTPLHKAVHGGMGEPIQLLLRAGASPDVQDQEGNTPLHRIFFSDEFRPDIEFPIFHALVSAKADLGIRNREGKTAYDLAVQWKYPDEYLSLLNPAGPLDGRGDSFIWLGAREFEGFLPKALLPVEIEGETWLSSEHYFHAQKVNDPELRGRMRTAGSVIDAMELIPKERRRPSLAWASRCDSIMRSALLAKFVQHPALRERLLATGEKTLVTDSTCEWYWVERSNVEFNTIGKMLISIRNELRSGD